MNSTSGNDQIWLWAVMIGSGVACAGFFWLIATVTPRLAGRYQHQFESNMGKGLSSAFLFFDPRRVFAAQLGLALVAIAGVWLFTGSWLLALLTALAVGFFPGVLLWWIRRRRNRQLLLQLPDAVMMMASSLRSGQALPAALSTVASEMPKPVSQEFELLLRECRLGLRIEQALSRAELRIPCEEFRLLSAAIRIALDTGGNLAEILEGLANTLRNKLALEAKLDALTSQGRMQAWVVGALPFAVALILYHMDREGMAPLFTTPKGWIACGLIIVLQLLGMLVIRRILRIDV